MNQNRIPRGTAPNIILNFSFLISAASFTLNLMPRAKTRHGIHETCRHHRKCDYGLSISPSIHSPTSSFLFTIEKQLGNHETCSHLRLWYFFLFVLYPVFVTPTTFMPLFLSLSLNSSHVITPPSPQLNVSSSPHFCLYFTP